MKIKFVEFQCKKKSLCQKMGLSDQKVYQLISLLSSIHFEYLFSYRIAWSSVACPTVPLNTVAIMEDSDMNLFA